jgi:phosphate starvation-inducible protein PhoH and related proteins|tara:strand:- start:15033 stop:15719 length:687 start_codon:yes stop_codon:yes gene_type:complete
MPKNNSLTVRLDDLMEYEPITINQQTAFEAWDEGDNLLLTGSAGTGKTFIAMFMALEELLDTDNYYRRIIVIRSAVPTRDMGFLPGTAEEKKLMYTLPYKNICSELFNDKTSWSKMTSAGQILFESTSFIRGSTFDDSIIIVDEMQNLNFHELDSVITRVGRNSRIIFCGDYRQTDFRFDDEKEGIFKFMKIMEQMKDFTMVNFGWDDIVRSGLVRDYIMTKEMLEID